MFPGHYRSLGRLMAPKSNMMHGINSAQRPENPMKIHIKCPKQRRTFYKTAEDFFIQQRRTFLYNSGGFFLYNSGGLFIKQPRRFVSFTPAEEFFIQRRKTFFTQRRRTFLYSGGGLFFYTTAEDFFIRRRGNFLYNSGGFFFDNGG